MLIGEVVESVYLKVSGFDPSTDGNILRADILAILPAAVNFAMDAHYNQNAEVDRDRDMPSQFYGVFENVKVNTSRPIPFIELSKGVVPLKGNAGIRFVYNDRGDQFAPLSDADMGSIKYYQNLAPDSKWYRRRGNFLDLYGLCDGEEELHYQAITSVEDLTDEDQVPVAAGHEGMVLEFLHNWFVAGVKPSEGFINTKDETNQI